MPDSPSKRTSEPAKFPATQRLLQKDGFGRVLKAENIADSSFRIYFLRNNGTGARLGIIASKRVLPKAVDRNRYKRIIRETFRQHQVRCCMLDLVVMVRHANLQLNCLRKDSLQALFGRIVKKCAG